MVKYDGVGYVLVKDIKIHRGKERAVALYNPSDEPHHFECPLELLAFEGEVKLRDVVRREDLGKVDRISMELPAHSAKILTVKGLKGIEQKDYEAEWGFIPTYNDIGKGGADYVRWADRKKTVWNWTCTVSMAESAMRNWCTVLPWPAA